MKKDIMGFGHYPKCTEKVPPMNYSECQYKRLNEDCSYDGACYAQDPKHDDLIELEKQINAVFRSYRPK